MSDRLWISAAIVFHLVAISLATLPLPADLPTSEQVRRGELTSPLTSLLDRAAFLVTVVEPQLYTLTAPVRVITQPYIETGLRQKWNMFGNPNRFDTYMRVDYLVAGPDGRPNERVPELVFPAAREDRPRWLHAYRDKAVFASVENYLLRVQDSTNAREISATPPEMVPIARYFGRRFARSLPPARRLVRVEIWYGSAPIPPPDAPRNGPLLEDRFKRLERYRSGVSQVINSYAPPRVNSVMQDGDIAWDLFYAGAHIP